MAHLNVIYSLRITHDSRLTILDDVPEALAELTVKDASDVESLGHENPQDNFDPPSDPRATHGSSDAHVGDIPEVSNFASTLPNPNLPCHIIPTSRNTGFYGREDVLKQLDRIFLETINDTESASSSGKEPTMFALVSPGGVGKTQIATEFVHSRRDRFDAIFWIYADQTVKLADGFSKFASKLGLVLEDSADSKDPVVIRETVKGWMANPVKSYEASEGSVEKASWLLVFDNADSSEILSEFWPADGPGCVLLTSRYPFHLDGVEDKMLQPFSTEESFNFLMKLTKREEDPDERQPGHDIAEKLGGLPLALTQMAGIITRKDLSFVEFLAAYDEREDQEELFETKIDNPLQRRTSTYAHTLASVWALESLKHGRALLDILSLLDPDEIPEAILTAFLSSKNGSKDPPILYDYPRSTNHYQRARTELLQSSLIFRERAMKSIIVHRMVQDVARAKMTAPRLRLTFSTCLHLVSAIWPFEAFGWRHGIAIWSACEELFPHVMKLKDFSEKLEDLDSDASSMFQLARLLTDAGWFHHEAGNSLEALPFFEKAKEHGEFMKLNLADELFTDDTISTEEVTSMLAEIHHNIGCLATETKKPVEAVRHFTIFNDMMAEEARLNDKQKEYAISWNELGIARMMNRDWQKAESCFLRSIEIMKSVDASAKELQSLPTVNLGLAYWLQGDRLEEADSVTGRFLHAIGNVKADLAKQISDDTLLDESRQYHQRALSHYRDTVGKNHHRTADTCVKVADHCIRLNMLDAASSLLDQALKVFTGRPVYLPEKARAIFMRARVLELLGHDKEAAGQKETSIKMLNKLTASEVKAASEVTNADLDKAICFWSR
ncbi:putative tetratricopeptide repeat domain-containing protein [Botryosphaeria dothidea]|uniref:Tetratricopeptide repeat domain-containing protein n=1 Tax=Botryosphaeria dothidea TaxID=55169 RepID=A0A8H4IX07_9PEZI|nr:putative tetratricopeptide repeat domain-containing protein [Botryosphaeria dothidea]